MELALPCEAQVVCVVKAMQADSQQSEANLISFTKKE